MIPAMILVIMPVMTYALKMVTECAKYNILTTGLLMWVWILVFVAGLFPNSAYLTQSVCFS